MKNNKLTVTLILTALLMLSLTACMNSNTQPEATLVPEMTMMPGSSMMPGMSMAPGDSMMPGTTNGVANPNPAFDWMTNASQIEANINQLSEVSESRVVVEGTTALVGIKFSSAYQGEMTDRIREMVASVVKEADPSLQTVAVTSEPDDVEEIFGFSDQITTGMNGNSLGEDINRIVNKTTTMR